MTRFVDRNDRRLETAAFAAYAFVWCAYFLICLTDATRFPPDLEEMANGNLARGILEGFVVEPWHYQYYNIGPGPVIYGLLLAPLYAIFGSNMLVMKCVGMAFAFGGVALWIVNIRKEAGPGAAAVFALWMLFPPPFLLSMFHLAWANHMETVFFSALVYFFWDRCFTSHASPSRAAAFGGTAGFACYFCLQNVLPVASLALLWALRARGDRPRQTVIALVSGAAGFSPYLIGTLLSGRQVPVFASPSSGEGPVLKLWRLAAEFGPSAANFSAPAVSAVLYFVGGAAIVACARAWFVAANAPERDAFWLRRFVVVWAALFAAAYAFAHFEVDRLGGLRFSFGYRYLAPMIALAMIAVIASTGRRWWIAAVVAAPFAAWGVHDARVASAWSAFAGRAAEGRYAQELLCTRGDHYEILLTKNLGETYRSQFRVGAARFPLAETFLADRPSVRRFPSEWSDAVYEYAAFVEEKPANLSGVFADDRRPERLRRAAMRGAGRAAATNRGLGREGTPVNEVAVAEAMSMWPLRPEGSERDFLEGVVVALVNVGALPVVTATDSENPDTLRRAATALERAFDFDPATQPALREALASGMARGAGLRADFDSQAARRLARAMMESADAESPDPTAEERVFASFMDERAKRINNDRRCLFTEDELRDAQDIDRALAAHGMGVENVDGVFEVKRRP